MAVGTIKTVAAVCIRDQLNNLSIENVEWCIQIILESIFMHSDISEGTTAYDKTDYYGSGACAFVLSKLFELDLNADEKKYLKFALATALTHENLNVCASAAKGVREFLWSIDNEFASSCMVGAVEYAKFRRDENESRRFYYLRRRTGSCQKNWEEQIAEFRHNFAEGNYNLSVDEISLESHSSWFLHLPMLMIPLNPTDRNQIQLVQKL